MNATQSLSALVETAVDRHQTSVRQLSFLAQKQGFKVTHTTLNQVRSGTYKSVPSEVTIRAIAWLAGVDASVAFTAAGQAVPGPPFAEELPPGVDNLSPMSRKVVLDIVRRLVELEKDENARSTEDQESSDGPNSRTEPRNTRAGQKTHLAVAPDSVGGLDNDALDRLHQERWQDLAAKEAPGGISHDHNPEDT